RGNSKASGSRGSVNLSKPASSNVPASGIQASRIGGLRSLAQLHAELQAPRILPEPDVSEEKVKTRRNYRRKARDRRLPPWIWFACGIAATLFLVFVGPLGLWLARPHDSAIASLASNNSRSVPPSKRADQGITGRDSHPAPPAKEAPAIAAAPP